MKYQTETYTAEMKVAEFVKRYVDVEKFLAFCRECPNYNVCNSCPPYDFEPLDVWNKYETVKIVGVKIIIPSELAGKTMQKEDFLDFYEEVMSEVRNDLYRDLKAEEEAAPDRYLLHPGRCSLCGKGDCDRNRCACKHPELRRYSIEALGGDVCAVTGEMLGLELCWVENGIMPEYLCQIGGVLYSAAEKACE